MSEEALETTIRIKSLKALNKINKLSFKFSV
jgi:hypothetical protein